MIIEGLNYAEGIAVCANRDIVVAECIGNCIKIFNKEGKKIRSIKRTTLGWFDCPRGVGISNDGHILVTDRHRLQKLTTNGVCVQSVGSSNRGNGSLEFNSPKGIAVHPTMGEIFVADCNNDRIQVLNGTDLSFSHTIRLINITRPWDIAVDSEGYLYLTSYDTHEVYKFTTTGQYMHTIVTMNNSSTTFLAIHHKNIYITDTDNYCVLIYDTNGTQLHSFVTRGNGEGEFDRPTGITVDTAGNVYVCDNDNKRIAVY